MDAKELRIGNLLCITSLAFDSPLLLEVVELKYKYARVRYQYEGKEKTSLVEYSELGYVALTEDWLLKFGFEKGSFYNNYVIKISEGVRHSIKYKKNDNGEMAWIYHVDESDAGCYELCELECVHHVQNLVFEIARKELNTK